MACVAPVDRVSVWDVDLETGMRGDAKLMVTEADTALALGSGIVNVLGSPRLVALCEEACHNALAHSLETGTTTVGMRVQFDHLQPTPIGAALRWRNGSSTGYCSRRFGELFRFARNATWHSTG